MVYLLWGENSYRALRKINEFKAAFFKKRGNVLVEELDGENPGFSAPVFRSALGQGSLFSKTRLVISRNIFGASGEILKILKENAEAIKNSKDIFVFWEKEPEKPAVTFFKKYSEKVQETKLLSAGELDVWLAKRAQSFGVKLSKEERALMIEEAGAGAEWALENELEKIVLSGEQQSFFESRRSPLGGLSAKKMATASTPFGFVEKIFSAPFGRALLALKEAEVAGQDLQRLIYPLLWKAKQKKMPDAYLAGILAESAMKRNPKNSYEILERFILAIKA